MIGTRVILGVLSLCLFLGCKEPLKTVSLDGASSVSKAEVSSLINRSNDTIISKATKFLSVAPMPLTLFKAERSAGTSHDFYSEGDYWWPDSKNPEGPYIRKDGMTNPANFLEHRKALRNLNEWVSTLVAAYEISKDQRFADHAIEHLSVFFLNKETLMNSNLLFAQAIKGRHTGRGIGIIDTIHFIEVAKAILRLIEMDKLPIEKAEGLKNWFADYTTWMNTHEYGVKEKNHGNNHSTWWAAQVAAFANLTGRSDHMKVAQSQFKKLLSAQMEPNGGFTDELSRTKPYIYMLFHLEGYAVLCDMASTPEDNLWTYEGDNGSVRKAWDFMMPYIKDKSAWTYPPDVQNFDEVPIQTVGHLLAAVAYDNKEYLEVWKSLEPHKNSEEIKRNFPLWHPRLWVQTNKTK